MATYLEGDFSKKDVVTSSTLGMGSGDTLIQVGGILRGRKIVLVKELLGTKLLTEETAKDFLSTAGWGILGGALLGPAGLLAGVLAKGNKKSNLVACELKTGEKFVMEFSDKEYWKILDKVPYTLPDEVISEASQTIETQVQENPIEMIKKLFELKEAGILSEDEFNTKKAELLSKI